ncbi:MAG: thymidylate synthase [Ignisphaera sp.]|uniref:Thymidylate synthase/dCMP hydroxymethylase domain-containing protein n=1 Tax=Ignisphaera aggregans TaxID=334771 RepID=A0A7C4NNZ0_9CREN
MIINAQGRSLPEVWEQSLVKLAEVGVVVDTEYGEKSIDAPAVIVVEEPFSEPRVHLRGIVAGSLRGLIEYVEEVIAGVHDYLVDKFGYTYHERLFGYKLPNGIVVNQVERIIDKLRKTPYTRRAQAITWQPWKDLETEHPPCLQRIWFRVVEGELVTHVHMRSNDALKAAYMNMYAFTELQRYVAQQLDVPVGRYIHIVDSYHVYERDWKWFNAFVEQIKSGETKKRWRTTQEYLELIKRLEVNG